MGDENKQVVYVYGTLRPGSDNIELISGVMVSTGWYPGIKLAEQQDENNAHIVVERVEVSNEDIPRLDAYEGYDENDPKRSLFVRKPFRDGWIYEFNQPLDGYEVVESGDWLAHKQQKEGSSKSLLRQGG